MHPIETITFDKFLKVELRVGKIVDATEFVGARRPAYILHIDFGEEIGVKKSSAQITALYKPEELIGGLVVAVVNFPCKQIGLLMSDCLVTGFQSENREVALCILDKSVLLGSKLL
ncbi:tRNA-binding protein [Synechococcus elongatus]|uniref:Protein secretion chaperonin CsaA n=1 Tax=Synechococcus sp. (strain ATCC 27144 / PCC 6301 / SAUG 1402/1) TaxID=269084 RepID=A0A0H3K2M8_SYNP6|nr:tRNA-binding protein [Synechococcus elongatus]WKW05759.1 tRNA-binding protein [Synechococcus elongatus PCC 7942 = FACHB-805]BAD79521.1 protein secretion chaperonin CsaA [Synechococcus elongatus PCC 6301]